ncbi:type I toxin-antitoxin system Fst family toxin [Cytobacillus sp. FSL W8-0315]
MEIILQILVGVFIGITVNLFSHWLNKR